MVTPASSPEPAQPSPEGTQPNGTSVPMQQVQQPQTADPASTDNDAFDRMMQKFGVKQDERVVLSAVNKIGEEAEAGYQRGLRTVDTPTYRAVWEGRFAPEHFTFDHAPSPPEIETFRKQVTDAALWHMQSGTLLNEDGKLSEAVLKDVGQYGWFGMMVKERYGGLGLSKFETAKSMTAMSVVNPFLGGLSSVHGSIGLVYPIGRYGNEEQQRKYLPLLASGEKLSAFALTEPSAGSDVTRIKATSSGDGGHYVLNGEKLFITNVAPGRLVGVVVNLDEPIVSTVTTNGKTSENREKTAVFIVELPEAEKTEHFEIKKYDIRALTQLYNRGLVFKDFVVPAENRLDPTIAGTARGDGITIGFTGLNNGRLAVLANAAGAQRSALANIVPWVRFRSSFGKTLDKHSHVQEMVGRMAANIVASDAMRDWVAQLMDRGFNCEMEAMNAKIFGSELQDQTTELFLKLQGGRSFLGQNQYLTMLVEAKACKIYEGENGLLHLGHEKQVLDDFNKRYGQVLFDPAVPLSRKLPVAGELALWNAYRGGRWLAQKAFSIARGGALAVRGLIDRSPRAELERMSHFAEAKLQNYWLKVFSTFARYGSTLVREETVNRQRGAQKMTLMQMKVISEWGRSHKDPVYQQAALVKCRELRNRYRGRDSEESRSDRDSREAAALGRTVLKGGFDAIEGAPIFPMTKPYDPETGFELEEGNTITSLHTDDLKSA